MVGGVCLECFSFAAQNQESRGFLAQLGDESALAAARITADEQLLAFTGGSLQQQAPQFLPFCVSAEKGLLMCHLSSLFGDGFVRGQFRAAALDCPGWKCAPVETRVWQYRVSRENLSRCGQAHQARSHVRLMTECTVGSAVVTAVRSRAHGSVTEPHAQSVQEREIGTGRL